MAKESVGIGTNIFVFILNTGITVNGDVWSSNDTYRYFGVKSDNKSLVLYFDLNGKTIPNIIGKDIFIYVFTENGLVPAGNDMTREEIYENCSASGNGYFCAAKIMLNSWQFSDENL